MSDLRGRDPGPSATRAAVVFAAMVGMFGLLLGLIAGLLLSALLGGGLG